MQIKEQSIRAIITDAFHMLKFVQSQSIQRGVWDNIPAESRKRMLDLDYIRVTPNVVYLTNEGLAVLGYNEVNA